MKISKENYGVRVLAETPSNPGYQVIIPSLNSYQYFSIDRAVLIEDPEIENCVRKIFHEMDTEPIFLTYLFWNENSGSNETNGYYSEMIYQL